MVSKKFYVIAVILFSVLLCGIFFSHCRSSSSQSSRLLKTFSEGSSGFYYNSPTLVDNYIYIGTSVGVSYDVASDNYFFKLDSNLAKIWEYPLGSREVRGSATLDSAGNIYFVVEDGRRSGDSSQSILFLYSLSNDGTYRWSHIIAETVDALGMSNPAVSAGDAIYVGGNRLYAYDTDGNEIWIYGDNINIMNAPIIDADGNIYFVAEGEAISLDSDGNVRWAFGIEGEFYSSPAFSTDASKIIIAADDTIYCLNATTGVQVWSFSPEGMSGTFRATPAVDNNDNIYLGTKANEGSVFYAVKADGSGLLWQSSIGADLYSSPALGNDGSIYFGSERVGDDNIRLFALNITTGRQAWSESLDADVTWSSPAISDNGTLYIATIGPTGDAAQGIIYSFRTDSTGLMANTGSPRFHEGNASTGRRD